MEAYSLIFIQNDMPSLALPYVAMAMSGDDSTGLLQPIIVPAQSVRRRVYFNILCLVCINKKILKYNVLMAHSVVYINFICCWQELKAEVLGVQTISLYNMYNSILSVKVSMMRQSVI